MKTLVYRFLQCTWGILQTTLGLFVFLLHIKDEHFSFHSAIITKWKGKSSVSLGMFVFVTDDPYFYDKLKDEYSKEELSHRLLVHEYAHDSVAYSRTTISDSYGNTVYFMGIFTIVL